MPDSCVPTGREMDEWIAEHLYGQPAPQQKADSDGPSLGIWTPCDIYGEPEDIWCCPEFSTNLTAAHEAEGRVPEELQWKYICALSRLVGCQCEPEDVWKFRRATPAQICEAIYRAMEGKRG